jgi:hypothetical protein
MFTFETIVDQAVKNTKQMVSFVKEEGIRKEFEALVDAQADYTKTVYNTNLELAKLVVENLPKAEAFDFSKFDVTKYFAKK